MSPELLFYIVFPLVGGSLGMGEEPKSFNCPMCGKTRSMHDLQTKIKFNGECICTRCADPRKSGVDYCERCGNITKELWDGFCNECVIVLYARGRFPNGCNSY